jgi:hypothetical protein
MYTPLDTAYILFETFFVCIKMRELFEVADLGGSACIVPSAEREVTHFKTFFWTCDLENIHFHFHMP